MANRIKISGTSANSFTVGINGIGNLTANNISITNANISNTITATYFVGDGSRLTGISGGNGNSTYSNTNVVNYYANNTLTSANANLGNTATANFFIGNGSLLTSITGANITGWVPNANNANYLGGVVAANYLQTTGTGSSLTAINGANVTGNVAHATSAYSVAVANVSGIGNIATINKDGNSSNILYGNGVFAAAPSGGGSYGNSNVASYYASNQIIAANASLGNTVVANYFVGNGNQLTGINGSNVTNTVPSANTANIANVAYSVSSANVGGLGNIASINLWSVTNTANIVVLFGNGQFSQAPGTYYGYSGSLYANNAFLGNGVYGNYFSGDGGNLSNINGSNITNSVAYANTANYVSYSNVGGLGNIATINLWGNPSTANNVVLFGNGQFSQAPLTYYGYSSNVWAGNAYFSNVVQANYFVGSGSQLTSIPGANVSGQVPNASVASTVYTNAQPNITSVGTLASLSVTGNISGGNISISTNANVTGTINAGNVVVTNGIRKGARTISAATTLSATDAGGFIELISYGNTYTVTLPDPTAGSGTFYKFWQNTSTSITLATSTGTFAGPAGGGSTTKTLAQATTPYWDVCSDGTNWVIFAIKMA